MQGCISDIQRFSIHDGPGIRTTVFLKGCPLRCRWCCNPESISTKPVLLCNSTLCISCNKCVEVCPTGASVIGGVVRSKCIGCGKCAEVCYSEAKAIKGSFLSPQQVFEEICKDKSFYLRTNGGVTFSGGEPLLQVDFLVEILQLCKASRIMTAIETCGYVPWDYFEKLIDLVDLFLFDIKSTDNDKHLMYTGAGCKQIMSNCELLAKLSKQLIIRVPVIPEFNFDLETLTRIVRFAEKIGVYEVHFLPYHRYATNKYLYLDQDYWNPGVECIDDTSLRDCINNIRTTIKLQVGG